MTLQIESWYPRSIKTFSNSTPKKIIMSKNGQKHVQTFLQKDIQIANIHTKKCSTSSAIREFQDNTTLRYHLTPVRMAKIDKTRNNKCWSGCGERVTLLHCSWECKLVQPLWRTMWRFLKKLKIELPNNCTIGYLPQIQMQ